MRSECQKLNLGYRICYLSRTVTLLLGRSRAAFNYPEVKDVWQRIRGTRIDTYRQDMAGRDLSQLHREMNRAWAIAELGA